MAKIFVSFNQRDRPWERWINARLRALGHQPLAHADSEGGINVQRWMESNLQASERFLPILSPDYFNASGCQMEYEAALNMMMHRMRDSSAFMLQVKVRPCSIPIMAPHRHISLDSLWLQDARAELDGFVGSALAEAARPIWDNEPPFPGWSHAISNIPVRVPTELPGRGMVSEIGDALSRYVGKIAAIALVGMPGSGKSVVAAAYAEQHRHSYKATWWIRANDQASMEADLAQLGVRLRWATPDDNEKEDVDHRLILRRLEREGENILLIYDNALSADRLSDHLPKGGAAHVLITSTALGSWSDLAAKIQIRLWPKDVGADFLLRRAGTANNRADAEALWEAFEGLPLALALIAAYCEDTGMSLAEFRRRHTMGRLTVPDPVNRTIGFVIDEAKKLHPGAGRLLMFAALLEAEPIPVYLFHEGADAFEDDAVHFEGNALNDAIAALRRYALIERTEIPDERKAGTSTDCIRLHRVVRQLAAIRWSEAEKLQAQSRLIAAMAKVYPPDGYDVVALWPRARRLDPHALALVAGAAAIPVAAEVPASDLMDKLASYRLNSEVAYERSRSLFERALALREKALGPFDTRVAESLNNLALLFWSQNKMSTARALSSRALDIREQTQGPEHPEVGLSLINFARILRDCGEPSLADQQLDRALVILETSKGPHDPDIAFCLSTKVRSLLARGRFQDAEPLSARALEIYERSLGPEHPATAAALTNAAAILDAQNRTQEAMDLLQRALTARENTLGSEHPTVAQTLCTLADSFEKLGAANEARALRERALAIFEHSPDCYLASVTKLRTLLGRASDA